MRKASRIHTNKKVSVIEEDEDIKTRKIEGKKAIIRAEFEKHKKEIMIGDTEASKINEIRLKNQLEELLNTNARKQEALERLQNSEETLEKQNLEATQFFETISRFETSKISDGFLSVGFHPNRTTASIFGMKEDNIAEALGEKMATLMETLSNLELVMEEQDKVTGLTQQKYDDLKKDHILASRKVNELMKMNDHANKRFTDLERIEFLARNKHAAASSDLKELKDDIRELREQEITYLRDKEDQKKRESEYLISKQNEMSNVLIELDKKKQDFINSQEEIKRLEILYDEMRDKRKNNRIVSKYIETLEALHEKRINLVAVHTAIKDMSDSFDASRDHSFDRGQDSPVPQAGNPVKRNSFMERNFYIEKIQKLYEKHPDGPHKLADTLIKEYLEQCYREESLKSNYEELQNNKRKQETELNEIEEELRLLKGKNEYITLGKSGSKILDSNEQEAIDSGMFIVDSHPTTLNQAKFDFENKKEADNDAIIFTSTEAFVLSCYMDSFEMMVRLSKILGSIYHHSEGQISEDMKELLKSMYLNIATLKRSRKPKSDYAGAQLVPELPELYRNHSGATNASEKEPQEPIVMLDLQEVHQAFLAAFNDEEACATEFVDKIKDDVMIISFITMDDIKSYLQSCQVDTFVEQNIQRAFAKVNDLRKTATETMLQRFETIYKLYTDSFMTMRQNTNDVLRYLRLKGTTIPKEDHMGRSAEANPFIQKAVQKKWKNLLDRYDYDPNRDYRKDTYETETTDHNVTQVKEKAEENEDMANESWDKEDTKAKLNEIVGKSKRTAFKWKNEEDQKRLQAKKEKEKQRQAIENMTEDDFIEYQRRKIKKDGHDDMTMNEINEAELFRKAQADLTLRLSSSRAPIEELKRMIQNSKVLTKIQILEKQKSSIDGRRTYKFEPAENYIPHDPIKVPRSPPYSANQTYHIRISKNSFTPIEKPNGSRFFGTSSDRMAESELIDTPKDKDISIKGGYPKSASKFKPIDARFDFNTEPNAIKEKPRTQAGGKRVPALDNFNTMPSLLTKPSSTQNGNRDIKPKKLLIETAQKKNSEHNLVRNGSGKLDLPKLNKKKKGDQSIKKKKKKNHTSDIISTEHQTLNNLFSIQTDPLLKMVYSPTFFASSASTSAFTSEDLGYRFDAFKFSTPGLLVSEKLY